MGLWEETWPGCRRAHTLYVWKWLLNDQIKNKEVVQEVDTPPRCTGLVAFQGRRSIAASVIEIIAVTLYSDVNFTRLDSEWYGA